MRARANIDVIEADHFRRLDLKDVYNGYLPTVFWRWKMLRDFHCIPKYFATASRPGVQPKYRPSDRNVAIASFLGHRARMITL